MKNKNKNQVISDSEALPFLMVRRAFIVCMIMCIVIIMLGNVFYTYKNMKQTAKTTYQSASVQTSEKVNESLKLLNSLASLELFYNPDIAWEEKVAKLNEINENYGYMFICYVDADIVVYTLGEEPASLANREHMQKVYASRQSYVTDSFVAGADGKTLNYTVIVPLLKDGVMTGSLFATIVLGEIENNLKEITAGTNTQLVLIGSKGQVMCSTNDTTYGASILDMLSEDKLFKVTTNQLEEQMLNRQHGFFQSIDRFNLKYTKYGPVENSNWDILVEVDFKSLFLSTLPFASSIMAVIIVVIIALYFLVIHYMKIQSRKMQNMVKSIQEVKKKIYQSNDYEEQMDYENIIQMSSKGLTDELTGTSTRVMLLDQAKLLLENKKDNQVLALCFIDLDDLKSLNDIYGHSTGDIALKKIGSILCEYGVKYDGLVGRYGGDEFILILRDIDSREELNCVLVELVNRLKFNIPYQDKELAIHCSIGVSLWSLDITLDQMISNADKALYDVKRHGKANYSVYLNGEHNET